MHQSQRGLLATRKTLPTNGSLGLATALLQKSYLCGQSLQKNGSKIEGHEMLLPVWPVPSLQDVGTGGFMN